MGTWQMMSESVAVDRTTSVADPTSHAASCLHEMLLAPPPDPTQTQKAHSACDGDFNLPPTKSTSLNSRGHHIRHSYSLSQDVRYRNSQ